MSYLMNHTVNNDVMIYIDSFQFFISKVSRGKPPKPFLPPPPPYTHTRDSDTPSPLLLRRSRRPTGVMHAFSLCIVYLSWLHSDFTLKNKCTYECSFMYQCSAQYFSKATGCFSRSWQFRQWSVVERKQHPT